MKPIQLSIVLAVLATVAAPVLRSQDAPKPDASTPGLGTPIAVPEGFVSLDGKAYFIRNGQAVPIDAVIANRARDAGIASPETLASSLKPGTMMTLEGKVIAIPSGVVFSKSLEASAPVTDDRAADRAISSQNTTGLAPAPKNPNMLGQPGNISAPSPSSNGNGNAGAATGSGSSGRRGNNVAGGGNVTPLDGSVVVSGTPQTTGGNSTANPDGSVTTVSPNGTATTVNPNGTTTTVTANGLTSTVPSNAGTSNSTPATNANGGAGVNGTTNANMTPGNNNGTVPSGNATNNGTVRSVDAVPNGTGINNPNNTGAPNGTSTNANGTSNNANGSTNNNANGTNNKTSGSSSSSGTSRGSSSGTSKSGGSSSGGGTSGGAGGGGARAGGR